MRERGYVSRRSFPFCRRYWYKNVLQIPTYFRIVHQLIKYGYDGYAVWDTFSWFIEMMKSILSTYRENHHGVPIIIDDYPYFCDSDEDKAKQLQNEAKWNEIIDSMIQLLDEMDENSSVHENISPVDYQLQDKQMTEAKNKFFALFSKYFYCLWD